MLKILKIPSDEKHQAPPTSLNFNEFTCQKNRIAGDKSRWPGADLGHISMIKHKNANRIYKTIPVRLQGGKQKRDLKNTVTLQVIHVHTNKQKNTLCNTQADLQNQAHRPKLSSKASLWPLFRVYRYYSDQLSGRSSLQLPIWVASFKA